VRSHGDCRYENGGELADPYVFVKYAVRYKGEDETIGARAYPLAVSTAVELCEAEPLAIDEASLATDQLQELARSASSGLQSVARSFVAMFERIAQVCALRKILPSVLR